MIHFQHLATLVKIRVIGSGRGLLEGVGKKAKKERKKERKEERKKGGRMPAPRICGRIPGVGRGCRRWAVGGGRAGGWALKSGARYASTKVVLSSVPSRLTSPASSETSGGEVEHRWGETLARGRQCASPIEIQINNSELQTTPHPDALL